MTDPRDELRRYRTLIETAMAPSPVVDGEPVDGEVLDEVAPDAPGAEDWIAHRTADFKERYGKRWKAVLFATAWKRFGKKSKNKRK